MAEPARYLAAAVAALLLLLPGAAAGAAEGPQFPEAMRSISDRADTLRAEVEASHGADARHAEAIRELRSAHQTVATYNGTLLAGFALHGLSRMEAVKDYLRYQDEGFRFINLTYIDQDAAAVRAKGNATRDRLHQMEGAHGTVAGLDLLIYAATYVVQGDLSTRVYEYAYRSQVLAKREVDARLLPGMYGELALADTCYEYANLLMDRLEAAPPGGPSPRAGALDGGAEKATKALVDVKNDRVEEWLHEYGRREAANGHRVYPIAARLLQVKAMNLTGVQYGVRLDNPPDAPANREAAREAALTVADDVPGGFLKAGFPGHLALEAEAEVAHYLNRTDTESLHRAYAGAAMLRAMPAHVAGLAPAPEAQGSRIPAATPLLVLLAVALLALARRSRR